MRFVRFFDPKKEINFVAYFKPAFVVAVAIPLACFIGMFVWGINWGIDFTGGTELQVQFSKPVEANEIREVLRGLGFDKNQVQRYGSEESNERLIRVERMTSFQNEDQEKIRALLSKSFSSDKVEVKFNANMGDRMLVELPVPAVDENDVKAFQAAVEQQHTQLAQILDSQSGFRLHRVKGVATETASLNGAIMRSDPAFGQIEYNAQFVGVSDKIAKALSQKFGEVEVRKVDFVDSQVSKSLRTDGALALFYALLAILIYVAIRFDIFFAPGAVTGLLHDTLGALVVFVFFRYEFDLPSVAALLTIVGYSINNTIVIYDRIRETTPKGDRAVPYDRLVSIVNKAINDTLSRTINTTLTTLMATVPVWLFGGAVLKSFAFALSVGIFLGSFASTMVAPAVYLFIKRNFSQNFDAFKSKPKHTRADKERGVV